MKASKGQAKPELVNELVKQKLVELVVPLKSRAFSEIPSGARDPYSLREACKEQFSRE